MFIIQGTNMISTKRATTIICEEDRDKRNELLDKLSEEDAKYLLKQCISLMNKNSEFSFTIN